MFYSRGCQVLVQPLQGPQTVQSYMGLGGLIAAKKERYGNQSIPISRTGER
jgi:hypothetical protein